MKEINQRRRELNMTEDEWVAVWMLGTVKNRKRLDRFVYQALRDVVKTGGEDVIKNFEETFKRLQVEGCRKDGSSSSVMYTEEIEDKEYLPPNQYNETEMNKMHTMFIGTESKVRKPFSKNGPNR